MLCAVSINKLILINDISFIIYVTYYCYNIIKKLFEKSETKPIKLKIIR